MTIRVKALAGVFALIGFAALPGIAAAQRQFPRNPTSTSTLSGGWIDITATLDPAKNELRGRETP